MAAHDALGTLSFVGWSMQTPLAGEGGGDEATRAPADEATRHRPGGGGGSDEATRAPARAD